MPQDVMTAPPRPGVLAEYLPADEASKIERVLMDGDLSRLSPEQRVSYHNAVCQSVGVNPLTKPFQYITLNGKLVLYALKGCADQLSSLHGIVCEVVEQRTDMEIRIVTVRARTRDGRQTDEIGCVPVKGLAGEALANAMMKAITKAKRRAVLSLCGLGMLDETEVESIAAVERPASMTSLPPRADAPQLPPPTEGPAPVAEPPRRRPIEWPVLTKERQSAEAEAARQGERFRAAVEEATSLGMTGQLASLLGAIAKERGLPIGEFTGPVADYAAFLEAVKAKWVALEPGQPTAEEVRAAF